MKHAIFACLSACIAFLASLAAAQETIIVIPGPEIILPPVFLQQNLEPIQLTAYKTEVRVEGFVCQTDTTLTFYNPNSRTLEGDLVFPLPEGVSISGYALDINGAMADAVAVSKEKARTAYETEIRKGVDPGIVEKQRGNQFKTRIFPLPAQGSRTVRISYVSTAQFDTQKQAGFYRLPLNLAKPVKQFSLKIAVIKPSETPKLVGGDLGDLKFDTWSEGLTAQTEKQEFQTNSELVLEIPAADGKTIRTEKASDGYTYFTAAVETASIANPEIGAFNVQPFTGLSVFWDCSGSQYGKNRAKEIAFLKAWMSDAQLKEIRLIPVRNTIEKDEIQTVTLEKLEETLNQLPCDGATNPAAISVFSQPGEYKFFFTDGFGNWGESDEVKTADKLYTFSSGTAFDADYLKRIAKKNNGVYINLESVSCEKAMESIKKSMYAQNTELKLRSIDAEIYPPTLSCASAAPIQFICGRTKSESALIIIPPNLYRSSKSDLKSTEIAVPIQNASAGQTLRTLFAQAQLGVLALNPKENAAAIEELGKTFSLATSETSLIVLESLEQYLQHDITPPESQPQWREQFLKMKSQSAQEQKDSQEQLKAQRLEYVNQIWNQRNEWYKTEFKYTSLDALKDAAKKLLGGRDNAMSEAPAAQMAMEAPAVETDAAPRMAMEEAPAAIEAPHVEMDATPAMTPGERVEAGAQMDAEAEEYEESALEDADTNSADDGVSAGEMLRESAVSEKEASAPSRAATMEIKPWTPDSPYLKTMEKADNPYLTYVAIKGEYEQSPSFYLECAEFFQKQNKKALAIRVLSNLAEMDLENPQILRVLGYRLLQYENPEEALPVFQTVLNLRAEEPQSYRDLAIALSRRAEVKPESAKADYAQALELYNTLVWGRNYQPWDGRFREIEIFALEEANALIPAAKKAGVENIPLDKSFIRPVDVDVRIVMTWSADNTDIDLWVTEPTGEKVYYGHNRSLTGGLVSCDFTGGYGPEEYMVRKARKGKYTIQAHFYGSRSVEVLGAVTVQADVYTNFGRDGQKRQSLTFPLKETGRDVYDIGVIEF